jgi:5-(hydroxymethyl)furfural/furfural oxidase
MDHPDFLIIGAGSAGAVLASRLSEDRGTRVLVVEAGRDTPPAAIPADIADTFPSSSLNASYFWPGLQAVRSTGTPTRPYVQARVMGGGSSVMGLWALRGMPSDYDSWAAAGAEGWSWSDVLPVFRHLENDADRDQTQTTAGPYPILRLPREEWPGFVLAVEREASRRGLRFIDDMNETPADGFFAMPLSQDADGRASSARCYLTQAVRRRSNLSILAEATVTNIRFDGLRACGATIMRGGEVLEISAREVILCAGAIHSPVMLLRAGIGPSGDLERLGITPRADRAGVGRNLQNHPYLHFGLTLPPRSRLQQQLRRFAIAGMRLSSGANDCPAGDLLLFLIGRVSPRAYGSDMAMFGAALYSPWSCGQVSLASAQVGTSPRIEFRMFEDPRDPPRMLKAARFAESLLLSETVAAAYNDAFLLPPVMALQQFNRAGVSGSLMALAVKAVLNAPPPITRGILGRRIYPGRWIANRHRRAPASDAELIAAAAPMAHPVGTCAIGPASDSMAVVDAHCRVHGIENLRVIDASVMPRIPSANTNLPTIMVAERAVDLIRSEHK